MENKYIPTVEDISILVGLINDNRKLHIKIKEWLKAKFPDYQFKLTDTMINELVIIVKSHKNS